MKSQRCSTVLLLIVVFWATTVTGRNPFLPSQEKEDLARKGMDIYLAYDSNGRVLKISITSNQIDEETKVALPMERQRVLSILEELVPEEQRGAKTRQHDGISFGRAYGESIIYEKAQISLTIVCRENACGVTYAEMRVKE